MFRNIEIITPTSACTLVSRIDHTVYESFLKIREISYKCKYLTSESAKNAVYAYIVSRLANTDSSFHGLPKEQSRKLQTSRTQPCNCSAGPGNSIMKLQHFSRKHQDHVYGKGEYSSTWQKLKHYLSPALNICLLWQWHLHNQRDNSTA